jgi:RHS repeat-associated protein
MAGISSKAAGKLENKFKFNEGTELTNDFDINLYETKYRGLDPQIGRFWQIDPLAGLSFELSPYNYGSNNPILRNDPLGLKDTAVNQNKPVLLPEVIVTAKRRVPTVQVYIWSKTPKSNNGGNIDVGHTAIRLGNLVYGFYPTDKDGDNQWDLMGSPGEMHVDTVGKGGSFDRRYLTQEITAFQLRLTPEQIKKLHDVLKEIEANPGSYWLTGKQCTSVAAGALLRSGVVIGAQNPLEGMRLNAVGGMSPNTFKTVLNTPINKDLVERVIKFVVGQ